jgi:hypothetical protein
MSYDVMMNEQFHWIDLAKLHDHPQNPRLMRTSTSFAEAVVCPSKLAETPASYPIEPILPRSRE